MLKRVPAARPLYAEFGQQSKCRRPARRRHVPRGSMRPAGPRFARGRRGIGTDAYTVLPIARPGFIERVPLRLSIADIPFWNQWTCFSAAGGTTWSAHADVARARRSDGSPSAALMARIPV